MRNFGYVKKLFWLAFPKIHHSAQTYSKEHIATGLSSRYLFIKILINLKNINVKPFAKLVLNTEGDINHSKQSPPNSGLIIFNF